MERECCVRWPQYIKEKTECVPDISQGTIIKDDAMTLKKKKLNGEENCIITEHGWGKKRQKNYGHKTIKLSKWSLHCFSFNGTIRNYYITRRRETIF